MALNYSLIPFTKTATTEALSLSAELRQQDDQTLKLCFQLHGDMASLRWPTTSSTEPKKGLRRDELWKTTCLEVFLTSQTAALDPNSKAAYFEVNCSPNGDWNAYSFSSYRTNMQAASLKVSLQKAVIDIRSAHFEIEISSPTPLPIDLWGAAVVLDSNLGEKSYWALAHPASVADFHDKKAWIPLRQP